MKHPKHDLENIIPLLIHVWRRFHKRPGPPDCLQTREFRRVVDAVIEMEEDLQYGTDAEKLGAYLLYYWVIHYQQGLSLLGELPRTPHRVLDLCGGMAPFGFAALRHGAEDVYAADKNEMALEIGSEVIGRYGYTLSTRVWDCLRQPCPIEGKFDLIILGHCLDELFPNNAKVDLQRFLDRLSPEGFLLLVESSLPKANQRFLKIRDDFNDAGIPIQAPCVWKGKCPALAANNYCYAQRELEAPYLIREIQRSARIRMGSLKMSYLIAKSPQSSWTDVEGKALYRIISPPFEGHHGKTFYLCGTDGKKKLRSHLKKHPKESRAFEYLKRGELIKINKALAGRGSLEVIQGTALSVEAALGKPVNVHEV